MVEKAAGAAAQVEGGRRNLAAGETLAEVGKVAEVEAGKLFDTQQLDMEEAVVCHPFLIFRLSEIIISLKELHFANDR